MSGGNEWYGAATHRLVGDRINRTDHFVKLFKIQIFFPLIDVLNQISQFFFIQQTIFD